MKVQPLITITLAVKPAYLEGEQNNKTI